MSAYLYHILAVAVSPAGLPQSNTGTPALKAVLSIVFGIIGALALLMIVVSGFRYVLSAGEPDKISKAKNGIIYALVGLMVAILAQVIVVFVVERIKT